MVRGPRRYVLPVECTLIENRTAIPLDTNEGIYVRDTSNGTVRSVCGETYMLQAHEEKWDMQLDPVVEQLLGFTGKRDKSQLIVFKCPFNAAV